MNLSKLALTAIVALSIGTAAYAETVPYRDHVLDVNKITSIGLLGDISHYMHSDLTDSQQAALKKQREKLIAQGVKPDPVYEMSFEAPGYDDLYAIAESKRQKIIANATVKEEKVQKVSGIPEGQYICTGTQRATRIVNTDTNEISNQDVADYDNKQLLTYSDDLIKYRYIGKNGDLGYEYTAKNIESTDENKRLGVRTFDGFDEQHYILQNAENAFGYSTVNATLIDNLDGSKKFNVVENIYECIAKKFGVWY